MRWLVTLFCLLGTASSLVRQAFIGDSRIGRAEMFIPETEEWGSLCDSFYVNEGWPTVFCKDLKYDRATEAVFANTLPIGVGIGSIAKHEMACSPVSSKNMESCTVIGGECTHEQDVAVRCSGPQKCPAPEAGDFPNYTGFLYGGKVEYFCKAGFELHAGNLARDCVDDGGWKWTGSPPECKEEVDDCASSSCLNGGQCTDAVNGFTCACAAGFEGETCETDIDECASSPCLNGGQCTDAVNGFTCSCTDGFEGSTCETVVENGISCDEGWISNGVNGCYMFMTEKPNTFNKAILRCEKEIAKLLIIESEAELESLKSIIRDNEDFAELSWWTSGKRVEGEWTWVSDNTPITVFQWAEGQPDSTQGKLSCISLDPATDYKYNDGACAEKLSFVCKRAPSA